MSSEIEYSRLSAKNGGVVANHADLGPGRDWGGWRGDRALGGPDWPVSTETIGRFRMLGPIQYLARWGSRRAWVINLELRERRTTRWSRAQRRKSPRRIEARLA